MKIRSCKINHLTNPCGFTMKQVTASWVVENEATDKSAARSGQFEKAVSQFQKAARICVALDEDMQEVVLDTGEQEALDSRATVLELTLRPRTCYYWTVEVWGNGGDYGKSDVNWFETGKMEEPWSARWITTPWKDKNLHPYFHKSLWLMEEVECGRIYATGLGVYELEINGKRVTQERLTPGCTAYDYWVQVQTYDVTGLLEKGTNAIGAMVGNGWAKGRFGNFPQIESPRTDVFSLILELHVTLKSGIKLVFGTDSGWLCAPSPVLDDGIYDGEIYDARKEIAGWSEPCAAKMRAEVWEHAVIWEKEKEFPLMDRLSPKILVRETIAPVELIHTPADEWVLDFGQNVAGWVRFRTGSAEIVNELAMSAARVPAAGTKLKLTYGEVLQNDCFYTENLVTAKQEYHYICDGTDREVEPHFTFYGFRYVKLEGFSQPISLENFTACVVYSDLEETGWIETSDLRVNRLYENTKWSQKDNFLDVPTDCPQRDERMGWTGDAQVFCRTASYHMDTYAFYRKFLWDLWQEQQQMDGMVGCVVPSFATVMPKESGFSEGGSSVWGDCATIMPWTMYQQYGDPSILKEQYPSMKAWVEWIRRQCGDSEQGRDDDRKGSRLWTTGFHYGDWLALDGPVPGGTAGGTEIAYIASAYYMNSVRILADTAQILGYTEDVRIYRQLADEIREAIRQEYFSPNGRCVLHTQTAYLLALQFELVTEEQKWQVVSDLVKQCRKDGMHLTTGFVGTPFLCNVLAAYGHMKEAYHIFFQTDYPSWLYEVSMGATTIWERWNSILPDGSISSTGMNSLNHYSYGSIAEWMYRDVCGMEPIEPGWKRFAIRPRPDERLKCVRGIYESPMGRVSVTWEIGADDVITLHVMVPFGSTAEVTLEGATNVTGSTDIWQVGEDWRCELTAGEYTFRYQADIRVEYSFKWSLDNLNQVPAVREYLHQALPALYEIPTGMEPNGKIPFEDAIKLLSGNVRRKLQASADLALVEEGLKKL